MDTGTPRMLAAAMGLMVLAAGCPTPEPEPELVALAVIPGDVEAVVGDSIQLRAEGTWSDETTSDLTTAVEWITADPEEATVDDGGRVTVIAEGQATVTATLELLASSALLTIGPAVLEQLVPAPLSFELAGGEQGEITITARYGDESLADVTDQVTWSSSDASVVTAEGGVVTAGSEGTAELTASLDEVTAVVPVTVTPVELLEVVVAPAEPDIPLGTGLTFTATGIYSDGAEIDLLGDATWSSSDTAHVLIGADSGAAEGVGTGGAIIEAVAFGVVGDTIATAIEAEVVGLALNPDDVVIALGETAALGAVATLSDDTTIDATALASWSSDDPLIASASNDAGNEGLVTSVSVGQGTIRAYLDGFQAISAVEVTVPTLVSLAIEPASVSTPLGVDVTFSVVGTYTDGGEIDHTTAATWSTDSSLVAVFGPGATAVPVGQGTTSVSAEYGDLEATAELTVEPAALVSIAVTPPTAELPVGALLALQATGTYTTGAVTDITEDVFWASSAPGFVTVNNLAGFQGEATAVAEGIGTILASLDSITGTATVEVVPAEPVSIGILPLTPTVEVGATLQLTAGALMTDGTIIDVTEDVTWASLHATIATLANDLGNEGVATGVSAGTATVTATLGPVVGSTSVEVVEP
ncbi:MAG: hypothetical protein GY898_01350 [Proteobacteria bacterium]|nr:hypothetical protein [Pseudomonadota bacterium]